MDSDLELKTETSFAQRYLPWCIAGGGLLLYLMTLSTGITSLGLGTMIRVTNWSWQPVYINPLHYLLTYPIRWLPETMQIVALNSFAAICAALTLALLARSVAILPHDRTRDQRQFERSDDGTLSLWAWLPPLLAALACALQRTFWEQAVIGTGEALDILIFAYLVRNLLEYRLDERESWLNKFAVVYGLGVTNNFALVGFFPAFLVAVIWIKGRSFFNLGFCARMAMLGFAGLLLYLLLPLVQLSYPYMEMNFWSTLRLNWGYQKNMLLIFPRFVLLFVGLTSLLPLLFMGIKWKDSSGDISSVGNALTHVMMHAIHALFLAACVYVTFDTAFSPRKLAGMNGYTLLPFYYLGALSIGYFSGYFLLVFGSTPAKAWQRPSGLMLQVNRVVVGVIWVGLVALPVALLVRNFPHIQLTAKNYLTQFGSAAVKQLKTTAPQGALVLSDDPYRLYTTYKAIRSERASDVYPIVDTGALQFIAYHRYLHQRYPKFWPAVPTNLNAIATLDSLTLVGLLDHISKTNAVLYLHPSFGYYFERFYAQPRNLLYELHVYSTNMVDSPVIGAAEIQQNDEFWSQFKSSALKSLPAALKTSRQKNDPNDALSFAGVMYSRALNAFGVELQRAGSLQKAGEYFEAALQFYPENASALINRDFNKVLQSGKHEIPPLSEAVQKKLALYRNNMEAVLSINGPVDEPSSCYKVAESFAKGRNYRQAAQLLRRVLTFDPQNLYARLGLMSMYNQINQFDLTLQLIKDVRTNPGTNLITVPVEMEMIQSEANVYIGRKESNNVAKLFLSAQQKYPTNVEPYAMMAEWYLNRGELTNALKVLETEIKQQPEMANPLVNYARVLILNKQYEEAIGYLDRALQIQSHEPFALLNRAIANLKSGKLRAAETDYRELLTLLPKSYPVIYGLHEIAWQKKDRKEALKWAKEFMEIAPPGSPDKKTIQDHLKQLKSSSF